MANGDTFAKRVIVGSSAAIALQAFLLLAWDHFKHYTGFNFELYKYFAQLKASGVDVFDPKAYPYSLSWNYLDYTPANFTIYLGIFGQHLIRVSVVFILYEYALMWAGLYLLYEMTLQRRISSRQFLAVALLVSCNPFLTFTALFTPEDKALFFFIPVATCYLWQNRDSVFAQLAIGFGTFWSGSGIPILILRLTDLFKNAEGAQRRLLLCGGLLAGAVLAVLPFFPENLILFAHRADRESGPPFWFSIFRLVDPVYSSLMPKLLAAILTIALTALYWKDRITQFAGIIAGSAIFILCSNSTGWNRCVDTIPLFVIALEEEIAIRYAIFLAIWFALVFLLDRRGFEVNYPTHSSPLEPKLLIGVLLINMPVLAGLWLVFRQALSGRPLSGATAPIPGAA